MTYVLYDNQITIRENVNIDMEDRGYNFGDGIYEVIAIHNQSYFAIEEHLDRFEASASKLEIDLPYDRTTLENLLIELKNKCKVSEGIVYVQMTRGASPRAHLFERNVSGFITGFCREIEFPITQQKNGIRVYLTDDIRWLRCDIKTINLLGNTMVKRAASDNNCHEAIMQRDGIVTEGSSSNLFIVKNNIIYTHPATNLILNGITRQLLIKLAKENHFQVLEEGYSVDSLKEADEAFITSSIQEITPIVQIDGQIEETYKIGPITMKLQELFTSYINNNLSK